MAETAAPLPRPRYPIESVDSALRLLAFVADERSVSLSAAARHLDVAPSTAHRLLAMLEHYRLIERDAVTKAYALGPWLTELGRASLGQLDMRPLARPALTQLVDRVGETAHLVGLQGADAVFLDCVECNATVRATARTGQRLPAHCTAGGKAQLAALPRPRVLELLPDESLEGLTPESTRSRAELLRELDRIRSTGYATNRRESEPDVHAVAAAIADASGAVRGAVTVAGPPGRMKPAKMREIGEAVVATAASIGALVSAEPPAPAPERRRSRAGS
jgi:IclR family transcriptional regulator, acetate operon repressor